MKTDVEIFLDANAACYDGEQYAIQYSTMAEVWDNCPRVEWLIWMLARLGLDKEPEVERSLRIFACDCADRALSRVASPDPRSLEAVRVARLYADGLATEDELRSADAAARAADAAARAAGRAARSAAARAARTAAWAADAAADAAARAVWAAEVAVWAAEVAAGVWAAEDEKHHQAASLKKMIKNPFTK